MALDATFEDGGLIVEEYDWVYPYIKSLNEFCKVIDTATGKQVPITFPGERAFADSTTKVKIGNIETKRETLPLPYMSLVLLDMQYDSTRAQSGHYRKLQYSHDNKQVYSVKFPEPYNLIFQLDIRCKTNLEWFRIMRALHLKGIVHSATTIFAIIGTFGNQSHYVQIDGPQDNSDLEVGDNTDRKIRKTYTFTVEGWLLNIPEKIPTIRYTTIEVQDPDTAEVLESYTIDGHLFPAT